MITRTELESSITPKYLRTSRIIYSCIALGAVLYLFVIVLLDVLGGDAEPDYDEEFILLLCKIFVILALAVYSFAFFYHKKLLRAASSFDSPYCSANEFLAQLRIAEVIRLASFNAVVYFGLVITILSSINGLLREKPVYWFTAWPTLTIVSLVIATFPTKERIVSLFEEYRGVGR